MNEDISHLCEGNYNEQKYICLFWSQVCDDCML